MAMAVVLCNRPASGSEAQYTVADGIMALQAVFDGARDEGLLQGRRGAPLPTAAEFKWAFNLVLQSLELWQDRGQSPRLDAERFDDVARIYENAGLLQRRPSKRRPKAWT